MDTILETQRELELRSVSYDGEKLTVSVGGLESDERRRPSENGAYFTVTFFRPITYLVAEEFPAACADMLQGRDLGFLRVLDNEPLRESLGVDLEQFQGLTLFALITAHEILIALCKHVPLVEPEA